MEQLRSRLETILLKHFSRNTLHGLYSSTIQAKKLENVKAVHTIKGEEILFIYDATLFGSAKDGMVFTDKGMHWREPLGSPESLDYRELIESTVNKDLRNKTVYILDQDREIELRDTYYKLMAELRSDLKRASIIYETYYKTALKSAEGHLAMLSQDKAYREIISWLTQYEGLFLKPRHKSVRIREMSFEAYLSEKMFPKAQEQLTFIEDKNPDFYAKAVPLLEQAMKEERYKGLEARRLRAIENNNFKEAYMILEEERGLNLLEKADFNKLEKMTREAHYASIGLERLAAIKAEDYNLADRLLEEQNTLNVKGGFEIDRIRRSMAVTKRETLKSYTTQLNNYLKDEKIAEAEAVKEQIYKIDPLYPLERENILLTIYQHDMKKAKEQIAKLSDPDLRLELEELRQVTIKKLNEQIRIAARNKAYHVFDNRPELWNYKDEYGMSAIDYFALEANLEGILKALDHIEWLLLPANIFGHNFTDLIGFACDPNLGNKKEDPLAILKKVQSKVDLKPVDDRIKYLTLGQERHFFSYKLSQEAKLSEMNEALMSPDHFSHILMELEKETYHDIDEIVRYLFASELEAIKSYPKKDEFETSEDYRQRCNAFKKKYLDRFEFIAEYKRQNQTRIAGIEALLKDKKNCFIPRISALVPCKDKEIDALRALKTHEDTLGLLGLYFPAKREIIRVKTGVYDADKQVFLMRIGDETVEMPMPLAIAKQFKQTFEEVEFIRQRVIKEGKIVWKTLPLYSSEVR